MQRRTFINNMSLLTGGVALFSGKKLATSQHQPSDSEIGIAKSGTPEFTKKSFRERSKHVRGIRWLTEQVKFPNFDGDTWSPAWTDRDELISSTDDSLGHIVPNENGMHEKHEINSNLAIYRITGNPASANYGLTLVNPMSDYGSRGEHAGLASWKANGMTCVDGTLYLSVSQHRYWRSDLIQTTYDASIVKSEDYGKTWSPAPELGKAMFPDNFFSTPWFVQYGKDYAGAPDDYVYAVSNDGSWNNGNFMMLGRVHRNKIGDLNANDWEFFAGIDKQTGKARWNPYLVKVISKPPSQDIGDVMDDLSLPASFLYHRQKVGMTGMQYIPAIERYILGQWFFPDLDDGFIKTRLILNEAPNPWGPWSWFHVEEDWGNLNYCPSFPAKWFEEDGRKLWITSSGAFWGKIRPDYTLLAQKMELVMY